MLRKKLAAGIVITALLMQNCCVMTGAAEVFEEGYIQEQEGFFAESMVCDEDKEGGATVTDPYDTGLSGGEDDIFAEEYSDSVTDVDDAGFWDVDDTGPEACGDSLYGEGEDGFFDENDDSLFDAADDDFFTGLSDDYDEETLEFADESLESVEESTLISEYEAETEAETEDWLISEEAEEEDELLAAPMTAYNLNEMAPFKGRTSQDVIARYQDATGNTGTYIDADPSSWYSVQASTKAPYAAGTLNPDTHAAMTKMVNFYRWLTGVQEFSGVSAEDPALQAQALIRNFASGHTVSSSSKPDDMPQELWDAGAPCTHNILLPGMGRELGDTPQEAVESFLNEGYMTNANITWTPYGIGHRLAIIGPDVTGMNFGFSGACCVGAAFYSNRKDMKGMFSAFPAPGCMPAHTMTPNDSVWHLQFDTSLIKAADKNLVSVTITNLSTGEQVIRTVSDNTLKVSDGTLLFAQPYSRTCYSDSFHIEISGLTDAVTGAEVFVEYTVDFENIRGQSASTVVKFTPHIEQVIIPESMATDENLEIVRAALPEKIWAMSNGGTDSVISIAGSWTLHRDSRKFIAEVDTTTMDAAWVIPGNLKRTVEVPYTVTPDDDEDNFSLNISPSSCAAGNEVRFNVSTYSARMGRKNGRICRVRQNSDGTWRAETVFDAAMGDEPCARDTWSNTFSRTAEKADEGRYIGMIAGQYNGSIEYPLYIAKAIKELKVTTPVSSLGIGEIEDQVYTGSAITPQVVVYDGDRLLAEGTDYTLRYTGNCAAGTAAVDITGKGEYSGSVKKSFTILPAKLPAPEKIGDRIYTGNELRPAVTVGTCRTGTDYTVTYADNIQIGEARVTVEGKGNYTGSYTLSFKILPKTLPASPQTYYSQTYTGSAIEPKPVIYGLTEGKDYVLSYKDNVEAGEAAVVFTGIGVYTGTSETKFTIVPAQIPAAETLPEMVYTGSELKPEIKIGSCRPGTDYTVTYANNLHAGSAKVTITGTGNYTGTRTQYFRILPARLPASPETAPDQVYTGSRIMPKPAIGGLKEGTDYRLSYQNNLNAGEAKIIFTGIGDYTGTSETVFNIVPAQLPDPKPVQDRTYTGHALQPSVEIGTCRSGTDYTAVYTDNLHAGTATVTIEGTGNYTGKKILHFAILPKALPAATLSVSYPRYTGSPVTPKPYLYGLTEGTDYTLSYSDNINAGTAVITITGIGDYTGAAKKTYEILPAYLPEPSQIDEQTFSGSALEPAVTVAGLKEGADFTVLYHNNDRPGQAYAEVTGTGNYSGKRTVYFHIAGKPKEQPDNGNGSEGGNAGGNGGQGGSVSEGGNAGGNGGRGGSVSEGGYADETEAVVLTVPVLQKLRNKKPGRVTVSWKKTADASGYEIRYAAKASMRGARIKNAAPGKTALTLKKVKKGKKIYVQIRSFTYIDGRKIYSEWSSSQKLNIRK